MNQTFTIEPLIPMALLAVDNTLDNQYWRFCADDVVDETGRFLNDDELTYENFDLGPDAILSEGTKVVMPYLWGWYDRPEGNANLEALTPATDYEVVLPKAATVRHVVHVILSQYHEQMQVNDASGRYFFIEAVREVQPGVVEIVWGT
jgi:hypothetical protein